MVATRSKGPAVALPSAAAAPTAQSVAKPPPKKRSRTKCIARSGPLSVHDFHLQAALAKDEHTLPGQLQGFMNMPVDIFSEVCCNLAPLDLRHLSLTSRKLRDILMSRNATHMWKVSRQNTYPDMPDCPNEVPEPQYACFMFVNECNACDELGLCMDFLHCLRFCEGCEKYSFIGLKTIENRYGKFPVGLLPDVKVNREGQTYLYPLQEAGSHVRKYYADEIAELYEEFAELPPNDPDNEEPSQRDEFVREFGSTHLARQKAGGARRAWLYSEIQRQQQARNAIHNQRRAFALGKCLELGYDERDFHGRRRKRNWLPETIRDGEMKEILEQHFEMTESEWEKVRPEVEKIVQAHKVEWDAEEARARRTTRERSLARRAWEVRRVNLPTASLYYPRDDQLSQLDPIKAILDADTPDITDEIWATVADAAAQFVQREQLSVLWDLCGRLGILLDTDDAASMARKLSLATSAFVCSHCDTAMWFPDLVAHSDQQNPGCLLSKMDAAPPGLLLAILHTLELSEDTTYETLRNKCSDHFACTGCDPKITGYYTIPELIIHYCGAHSWFTKAISVDRAVGYPNLNPADPIPNLFDDHDWMRDLPLCKQYRGTAKGTLSKLQNRFQRQVVADPDDDMDNMEDEQLALAVRNTGLPARRICLLCPAGFSLLPTSAAEIKLHIEIRHAKVPNLATDAAIFLPGDTLPHTPCTQTIR